MTQNEKGARLVLLHCPRLCTDFDEEHALREVSRWFPRIPLKHLGWNGSKLDRNWQSDECIQRVSSHGEARRLMTIVASDSCTAERPLVVACADPSITADLARHCNGDYVLCVALADEGAVAARRNELLSR